MSLDDALAELARVPTLLVALDFDGVLAPIVQDPASSRPLPGSAAAVRALAELPGTTVAMLSGRALHDLREVSGFGPPVRLVGSHGKCNKEGKRGRHAKSTSRVHGQVASTERRTIPPAVDAARRTASGDP